MQTKCATVKRGHEPKIRVGVLDDDPLRLIGLQALLGAEHDFELKTVSTSGLGDSGEIDVVILRARRGYSLASQVENIIVGFPGTRILATGWSLDEKDLIESITLGAKGYVNETVAGAEFASAIRTVNRGLIWAPRRLLSIVIERMIDSLASKRAIRRAAITTREKQVLQMLVAGRSNKEIAVPLGIEVRTVKAHVSHLMRKLGVKNRIAVSVQAIRGSIVSP